MKALAVVGFRARRLMLMSRWRIRSGRARGGVTMSKSDSVALCYDCGRAVGGDVEFVAFNNCAGWLCNDCAAAVVAANAKDGDGEADS